MAKIESYRDLIVWQQAMDLAVSIYEVTSLAERRDLWNDRSGASGSYLSACQHR